MLAAGNTVIVKPSELAPATAAVLANSIGKYFDEEVLAMIEGGSSLGKHFASLPWDHLTFTGSARIGREVMKAAAENLVPVTMELGGKNPAVFLPDGVNETLISLFLAFRNLKSGQVCTSPDYVMLPAEELENWIEIATGFWQRVYPGYIGHPDTTGIINQDHYKRVTGYIEEARLRNVRVVPLSDDEPDANLRQIPLTLIVDPPADLACMRDEVFGPVIPLVTYDSLDDAIRKINSGEEPLAAYIATNDEQLASQFVSRVRSGGTAVNNFGIQGGHVALPFGGLGKSGHGCHSGKEGVLGYSHTKSVFYGAEDSFVHGALQPPIGKQYIR